MTAGPSPRRPRPAACRLLLVGALFAGVALGAIRSAAADPGWQWYKADLHSHSAISSDAVADLGILSQSAKARGYNAVFLTDHNLGSSFPISGLTANHKVLEDTYRFWTASTGGSLTASTNEFVSTPVNTGTQSLHLKSTSSGYGETFVWAKRGPNLRSGDVILSFSVHPTRIDPGSGIYVSVSLGGDPTIPGEPPAGYTTEAGVVSPGKSTVLVWQLGSPRVPSSNPAARVITYSLDPYTLNEWNHYTISVSDYLDDIPAEDRPLDHNGLSYLKITAAASTGTVEAYLDTYSIDAAAPVAAADELVFRNGLVHAYDMGAFRMFPSVELGTRQHANRLNFDIADASQFVSYYNGADGIPPTQATSYPAMLNHPGSDGGVSTEDAVATQGRGADLLEVRQQAWIDIWDDILEQGVQILGVGSTDMHKTYSGSSFATHVYASALEFDPLVRSLFEGRTYAANGAFAGRLVFNLAANSTEPYPARYPVFVPDTRSTASVHLSVPSGLSTGSQVRWISDGAVIATDAVGGTSYDATETIGLTGPSTYVRAEVRTSSGSLRALTQPIFFAAVPSLPFGMTFHVDGVTTPDGRGYTRTLTRGIALSAWDPIASLLTLTLENPPGSLAVLRSATPYAPELITLDGTPVPAASSLAELESSSGGSYYYYDPGSHLLHVKALQSGPAALVVVDLDTVSDTEPPSSPGDPAAAAASSSRIELAWAPSLDNTGVEGYTVYRDGAAIATVDGSTLSYSDTGLASATAYTYAIDAFDAAGNRSLPSGAVSATTHTLVTLALSPTADTYVSGGNPNGNYGSASKLRADADPEIRSYLRFDVPDLGGVVERATLQLYAKSSSSIGCDARAVLGGWEESVVTFTSAPAVGSVAVGSSGSFASGAWTNIDVTSLVAGPSTLDVAITTQSTGAMSFASREDGASSPWLLVEIATPTP